MTEEITPSSNDVERVSRLTGSVTAESSETPNDARRFTFPREERAARRPVPRSYSAVQVSEEEKMWAAIAHGSVWITLLTSLLSVGFLAPVSVFVPLVIYFMYRKRSDFVAFHALQAFVLQLIGTVGAFTILLIGGTVWAIGLVISLLAMAILIGFILLPVWGLVGIVLLLVTGLLPLATLLFGTMAAIETYHGRDYRYPFVARWVDRQLAGGFLNAA